MDPLGTISQRVYRDGTRYIDGKYVKDLSALNRPLEQTIIIDDNADCISMQVSVLLWVWVEDAGLFRRCSQSGPGTGRAGGGGTGCFWMRYIPPDIYSLSQVSLDVWVIGVEG